MFRKHTLLLSKIFVSVFWKVEGVLYINFVFYLVPHKVKITHIVFRYKAPAVYILALYHSWKKLTIKFYPTNFPTSASIARKTNHCKSQAKKAPQVSKHQINIQLCKFNLRFNEPSLYHSLTHDKLSYGEYFSNCWQMQGSFYAAFLLPSTGKKLRHDHHLDSNCQRKRDKNSVICSQRTITTAACLIKWYPAKLLLKILQYNDFNNDFDMS